MDAIPYQYPWDNRAVYRVSSSNQWPACRGVDGIVVCNGNHYYRMRYTLSNSGLKLSYMNLDFGSSSPSTGSFCRLLLFLLFPFLCLFVGPWQVLNSYNKILCDWIFMHSMQMNLRWTAYIQNYPVVFDGFFQSSYFRIFVFPGRLLVRQVSPLHQKLSLAVSKSSVINDTMDH